MYYLSIPGENEDCTELQPQFFAAMLKVEKKYEKDRDENTMKELLCYYTDCVNYFEYKQQSISLYFQTKIKDIVKQIKQFGSKEFAQKNKEKMNQDVIRVMQCENITSKINESIQRQKRVIQTVDKIIKGQFQNLQKRIQKSKRTMSKCHSVTMSFGSIDSSPEKNNKKPNQMRQPLKLNSKYLFTHQIGYSDQQHTTS